MNTEYTEDKFPYSQLTDKIIGCAFEVHKVLDPGFIEIVYENASIHKLKQKRLKIEQQKSITVIYKGIKITEHRLDLLVDKAVIIENKAVKKFEEIHEAQILSYLKVTGKKIELLINFAKKKMELK